MSMRLLQIQQQQKQLKQNQQPTPSRIEQLQAERQNFISAFQRGDINAIQFRNAMAYQNRLIAEEQAPKTTALRENPNVKAGTAAQTPFEAKLAYQEQLDAQKPKPPEQLKVAAPGVYLPGAKPPSILISQTSGKPYVGESEKVAVDPVGFAVESALTDIGLITFGVAPAVAVGGALANTAVNEAVVFASTAKTPSNKERLNAALQGAAFTGIGAGALKGVGAVAPKIAGSVIGRAGVNAATGAGISYAVSGGDPESALFGAVAGAGGSVLTDKVVNPLIRRLYGYRVTRITGAEEIELARRTGYGVESQRLTQLKLEQNRVKGKYGEWLREYSNLFTPEEIELAGTQKLSFMDDGMFEVKGGADLQIRPAEPYISAAKGEPSIYVKNVGSSKQRIVSLAKQPGIVQTKTSLVGDVLAPKTALTQRTFTGAKLSGTIDRQIYLNYLKNVPPDLQQNILYQMGGLSFEQLTQVKPTQIKAYSNIVQVQAPSAVQAPIIAPALKTKTPLESAVKVKPTITQPTAKIAQPKTPKILLPDMRGLTRREDLIDIPLSQPKIERPQVIKPIIAPVLDTPPYQEPKQPEPPITITPTVQRLKPIQLFDIPKMKLETGGLNRYGRRRRRGSHKKLLMYPVLDPYEWI